MVSSLVITGFQLKVDRRLTVQLFLCLVILLTNKLIMGYTRQELIALNDKTHCQYISDKVAKLIDSISRSSSQLCAKSDHSTQNGELRNIQSNNSHGIKSNYHTRRGVRGGKNKQRPIMVHISQDRSSSSGLSSALSRPRVLTPVSLETSSPGGLTNLCFCVMNAQSAGNKTLVISDYIMDSKVDACVITESWIKEHDCAKIAELAPSGFRIHLIARPDRPGGGIAIIVKQSISMKVLNTYQSPSCELTEVQLTIGSQCIHLVAVYRPSGASVVSFMDEFCDIIENSIVSSGHLLIAGDFNFHIDNANNPDAANFMDIVASFGLKQHVNGATHKDGHLLDLIITSMDSDLICGEPVIDHFISDHAAVLCSLNITKPHPTRKQITYRKYRNIDIETFSSELSIRLSEASEHANISDVVSTYRTSISTLIDKHAPEKTKTIVVRENKQWYNEDIDESKRVRRKVEQTWRNNKTDENHQIYTAQKNKVNYLMNNRKTNYFSDLINENERDQSFLFRVSNRLMKKPSETVYPEHITKLSLANEFNKFFIGKIQRIRDMLDTQTTTTPRRIDGNNINLTCASTFSSFRLLTEAEVAKLISDAPSKSCELDPLPTWLLKKCSDTLVPIITELINLSLSTGIFPDEFKNAMVTPLLKKSNLEPVFSNFRPVSNLEFISKLIEKAVALQITDYIDVNGLNEEFQSAYRKKHSTETALLRVQNDVLIPTK